MKNRRMRRRIFALSALAAMLLWGGWQICRFLSAAPPAGQGEIGAPPRPPAMTEAQRREAARRAGQNAEAAALAAGQSAAEAKEAAAQMEKAAEQTFRRPPEAAQ